MNGIEMKTKNQLNEWLDLWENKQERQVLRRINKRMTQLNRIRDERGERTTDTNEIHGISFRKEIGKFLDFTRKCLGLINTFSKVTQCEQKIHSFSIY